MASYIHGNLARREQQAPVLPKIKEQRRVVVHKKQLPIQEKLLYLFTVAVCVIVASVIMWRYAQIYQMNTEIYNIQQQIKQIQAENDMLKQKIEAGATPEMLNKKAAELGFTQTDETRRERLPARPAVAQSTGASKSDSAASAQSGDKLAMRP